jgi:hypothetical protein
MGRSQTMERVSVVRTDDKALYKPPVDPVLVEIPEFDFATPHQWLIIKIQSLI